MYLGPFLSGHLGFRNEVLEPRVRKFIPDHGRIDLAVKEHLDKLLAVWCALDNGGILIFRNVRVFERDPFDLVQIDAHELSR